MTKKELFMGNIGVIFFKERTLTHILTSHISVCFIHRAFADERTSYMSNIDSNNIFS